MTSDDTGKRFRIDQRQRNDHATKFALGIAGTLAAAAIIALFNLNATVIRMEESSKMIAPALKALQENRSEIALLKLRISVLERRQELGVAP